MKETLSEYLDRVMRQKGFNPPDVQERCGIAESYVRRILNGTVTNLTVKTIATLAQGLEIDPVDLFVAAYGKPIEAREGVDMMLLADTVQKLIMNPELIQVLQEWVRIPKEHQKTFLQTFKLVQKQKRKAPRSRRK
jgi:transcriptional regulator with XRE-family HTH domain